MERTDLSRALEAGVGRIVPDSPRRIRDDPPHLVSELDPFKFMTAFADAVAGEGEVFLCNPDWGATERAQLAAMLALRSPLSAPCSNLGWLMIPTGGTSGQLKFARHDEKTLAAAVDGFTRHFGLVRVNAVGVLPLHHVSGLMAWLRCVLTGGEYRPLDWKTVEAGPPPDLPARPEGWVVSLVPTQLERLLRREESVAWLRQFRLICLGGAPAAPALLGQAAALRLPLAPGYGMTETAAMITALRSSEFLAGARSCGPALPHVAVKISAEGAVILGGESLFRGYYPGWRDAGDFVTADAGWLDAQDELHVRGRRDAAIITGGEKVDPAEVEAALRGTGEFTAVVVLGVADPEWGETVVAAYPASDRPDLARVRETVGRLLTPAKRPKRFVPLADWPENAQGKVDRARLRGLIQDLKAEI